MSTGSKLVDWLDHRAGVRTLMHAALFEPIPGGSRWRYVWGSTLVTCLATQVITGLFLWMAYSPSTQTAWESVFYIQHMTTAGWLLRGIHHYTAHAMVYLMVIHFVQVVVDGAYRAPRELNFVIGILLMFLVLGMALTGYLLPWDQKGYWATSVGTNLASQAPLAGPALKKLAIGGSDYGHHTLTRFFALHAGVLPGLMVVLLAAHIALFRRHGITAYKPAGRPTSTFWPDQVLKDAVAALAVLVGVLAVTMYRHGAELGAPADPANPYDAARPEGYFLFLFQFLKWFPGELEVWGAFVVPGIVTAVLFLMPWIGRTRAGHVFNVAFLFVLLGGAALLTAQAWHDDYYAALHKKDEAAWPKEGPAREKIANRFEASEKFLAAKAEAAEQAERAVELASAAERIPPAGALALMYDDPYTQGPRLFKQYCASCHNFAATQPATSSADHEFEEILASAFFNENVFQDIINQSPTAPNLWMVGLPSWINGILDPKQVAGPNFFGFHGSPFAKGDMVNFVVESHSVELSDADREKVKLAFRSIQLVLFAEAGHLSVLGGPAAESVMDKRLREGKELVTGGLAEIVPNGMSCVDCHKFHEHGELGMAPDLTGYMSRQWMIDFIRNPAAERFYGDRNDRMPAFAPHPWAGLSETGNSSLGETRPRGNQLDQKSIELIVDWLRGDWRRAERPDLDSGAPPASP